MKKKFIMLALIGLLISPVSMQAGSIDKEDLQKISANELENKALKNTQNILASLTIVSFFTTAFFGLQTMVSCVNNKPPVCCCGSIMTVGTGGITTGLAMGWYKIFKKRAERHGYKNKLLEFFIVDHMSRLEER